MKPSKSRLSKAVLTWFDANRRPMPWREDPSPYRVWISEIMSQQTRIDTVIRYFDAFMARFPTISSLAHAPLDDVLKTWQGLGYYSRARHVHQAAKQIMSMHQGELPDTYQALLTLPGIGPYTAGAIASMAFQEQVPCVDGNVMRVIARVHAITDAVQAPSTVRAITALVAKDMPADRPGDYNQALMELGALVCIPNGAPKCEVCPLASSCQAKTHGLIDSIPPPKKKTPSRTESRTVVIIEYNHHIAIRQRPPKGLLASMYEPFHVEGHFEAADIVEQFSHVTAIYPLPPHTHVYSHLVWSMIGYRLVVSEPVPEMLFVPVAELQRTYAIPNAFWPFLELSPYND